MSELGDIFMARSEERKAKKAGNLQYSLEFLKQRGHAAVQLSKHHVRVGYFDFWPSTGKFFNRETKRFGRGIINLLRHLEPPAKRRIKKETEAE